ncbi:MAG TPA: tetratricopeptide repeat protein, partial [Kofleriaceae bacterium]|nr:tetratricopeptide repeat protein [Kofleriaceae bacterium]
LSVIIDSVATPAADKEAIEQAVVRGSELLKQGKLEEAQKAFRAALLLDGDNARVLALLGLAHFRGNQFEQARAIYEDLVERAPTDASHRLNLGLVYLKLGDGTKAINSLEASRALDPSQGRAVSYLGLAYARAGRYAEAYRSFLLAGQNELASEIESNLTPAERDGIHAQLARSGMDVSTRSSAGIAVPRTASKEVASPDAPATEAAKTEAPTRPTPPPAPPARPTPDPAAPLIPSSDPNALRMSDSLQFVLPTRVGPVSASISAAVAGASPSSAAIATPRATGPIPLSQLATDDLVRPDDGDDIFEVATSGALVIRVKERVLTRLDGIHVTGGDLAFEPAQRRSRGHQTDQRFDHGGTQLHTVSGQGYLIAVPGKRTFTAVMLDDDIFYLREDLVFAFQATLRWENGNVPGLRGRLPVVQFRGDGAVALRTETPLVRVKLPPAGIVFVDAARLAGWIGRVIPRAVVPPSGGPMGDVCVECTGEGVVLVDATVGAPAIQITAQPERPAERQTRPPPPPPSAEPAAPAEPPIELDVVKTADWLTDDVLNESGRDEI